MIVVNVMKAFFSYPNDFNKNEKKDKLENNFKVLIKICEATLN